MELHLVDAFELPDWLGTEQVTWRAGSSLSSGSHLRGELVAAADQRQELDLLAVDVAYPQVTCSEEFRRAVHQAWQFGEVTIADVQGRTTAAVPGVGFDANDACEVIRRFAKAVGAPAENFAVLIVL
jgi:hypothetical protein